MLYSNLLHGNETREISFMKKVALHCFAFLLSVVALRLSLLSRAGMLLHRVALNGSPCVESPIRFFFLRLPVLFYSDLRSHNASRFSSYSMLVCMTDLKLLRYLRLCSVLTWWPGTEPWREMALKCKCSRTLPLRSNGSVTPCGGERVSPPKHLWRTA